MHALLFVVAALLCLSVSAFRAHAVFKNRLAARSASAHEAVSMSIVSVPSMLPQRPSLSVSGQELFKHFVDGNEIIIDRRAVEWTRDPKMDAFAAELLNLHEGSLELEALGDSVQVGQKSSNGLVEHVGEGVHVEMNTMSIDPDSRESLPTITRRDLRVTARLAIDTVTRPKKKPRMTCVGQAGTGKTRGGLAYTLQELLWRGEAVMRVGYKDDMTYLFLPNEGGLYKVWSTNCDYWHLSKLKDDERTYALIDPRESGEYKSNAKCHIIKWASNNAEKHYQSWQKDGSLLFSAMPTEAEVLAMIPILWDDELTPFPRQRIDTAEAKQEEIKNRLRLVGGVLRIVFNYEQFESHMLKIVTESKLISETMSLRSLKDYYDGMTTTAECEASSLSSRAYLVGSADDSHKNMFAKLNPLAAYMVRERIMVNFSALDGTRAFEYEDFVYLILLGAKYGDVEWPIRDRVSTFSQAETSKRVCDLADEESKVVVAHKNYPVLDMATAIDQWINAKVGNHRPITLAGAFVNVMTRQLGLACVDNNALQWVECKETKITLTFMRNRAHTGFEFKDDLGETKRYSLMDFAQVKAFFDKNVEVKYFDCSNLRSLSGPERDVMEMTSKLVKEYAIFVPKILK
ncbi:hypothetical protein B484DRAFT_437103 [Ochromonadaceae sp. CCMP2298]|nr:hypothetical protein B484DRAFT_437103 [Ochromonadaceae sp. CCMP2298]